MGNSDLITIISHDITGAGLIDAASGIEVHEFLGIGRNFISWIRGRIEEYDFVENQDFIISAQSGVNSSKRGRKKTDYILSVKMAKELSMIERTPKAKEARKYFLECERRLMEIEGAAGLPKTTLPATTKKKTIINANIVITYNTGETTVKSATPVNINKVLAHLAPKWLMVDMALANRRMGPVRELMAHTMNMYGDMTEALNERQRVMG